MGADNSNRAHLREELSKRFIPYLQSLGFELDQDSPKPDGRSINPFGTFTRARGSTFDVVEIQFDKYSRPKFIINFCRRPPKVIEDGQAIGPRNTRLPKLTEFGAARFQWAESFRLTPRPQSARWFAIRTFFGLRSAKTASKETIDRLMNLFPQVEAWFKDGIVGENLQFIGILVPVSPVTQD